MITFWILVFIVSLALLVKGADWLLDSAEKIGTYFGLSPFVIGVLITGIGTSLPELLVSVKAALNKKSDLALGNIFGSNVFNILVVVGLPGLFKTLTVDSQTFMIGVPALGLATLLFIISGISRRIHIWEGALYLSVYVLFIVKLFNWF